jgi:mannose-1-phosphate guanylyltransferase
MKAFILAAGSGTRLRPLTDTIPKCLLPIQGVPLLQIWLQNCSSAGITEVLVNVHSHAGQIREFAGRQQGKLAVRIAEEHQLLGSGGTLAENQEFVAGEEAFFVLYGDVLTNLSLADMLVFHRTRNLQATLGIHQVPDPTQCGIVTADRDGVVRSFVEKPPHSKSNWAFSGVMVASPRIFASVPAQRPADIGFHLLPRLIGQMAAYPISNYLLDIGTLSNYRAAQSSWPGLS